MPNPLLFIGVDPGVAGGIALLHEAGHVLAARKMPGEPVTVTIHSSATVATYTLEDES